MPNLKIFWIALLLPLVSGCATIDAYMFDAHPDGTPIRHEQAGNTTATEPAPQTEAKSTAATETTEPAPQTATETTETTAQPAAEPVAERLWIRITFKSGQTGLAANARSALKDAAGKFLTLKNSPSIAVRGYCDDEPIGGYDGRRKPSHTFDSQLTLSQARADAVRDEFIKAGIASDRVTATGHGATAFIADNDTVAGRNKNRRVDIFLVGK